KSGCVAAVSKFDDVGVRFPGTAAAADAMWEAAACYKSMGNVDKARELYLALRGNGSYKDRAEAELALAEVQQAQNYGGARGAAAGPLKAAAAPHPAPRPPPAGPPANSPPGDVGTAPAAPSRKTESGL